MAYYTSSFALRQSRLSSTTTLRRNQNTIRFNASKVGLGPVSNAIILALILGLLGLLYLTQITKQTRYGYEVNALETQKTELINQQESLKVEAARLQALDRVKNSKVAKQLNTPQDIEYIQ